MEELRTGFCGYCGNPSQVPMEEHASQAAVDEEVTENCSCEEAIRERKKKAQKAKCEKNIEELLRVEFPEIADLFQETVPCVQAGAIKSILADTGIGKKAKLSLTKDGIKVELTESHKAERTA